MKILIDGDSCNRISETERIAAGYGIETHIFCDTCHAVESGSSVIHIVDRGPDSADFAIIKQCTSGDIVITSDAGLAAMALAMSAAVLNPKGFRYTNRNVSSLLIRRHMRKQAVRRTGRKQVAMSGVKAKHMNFSKLLDDTIRQQAEKE